MITPLHTATVGGRQLRFFRTPLNDGRPDMPWHCVEDLHRCLGLNRDQRKIFLRKLKNSNWPTKTIAAADGSWISFDGADVPVLQFARGRRLLPGARE